MSGLPNDRDTPTEADDERDLMGLWLSRVMFSRFVGWEPETRTFEEFAADARRLGGREQP